MYIKRIFSNYLYVVIVLLFARYQTFGQAQNFVNLSTADGLSHKTVNCFAQDSKGFIWIGTTNGLNRFDGYRFKCFFFDESDSLSLAGNIVYDIKEDASGLLWLSTNNGFCYFNPKFETFHKIQLKNRPQNYQTRGICIDNEGVIWGTDETNILFRFSADPKKPVQQINITTLLNLKVDSRNWCLLYADGYIWIGSSVGIIRFDNKQLKAKLVDMNGLSATYVRKMKQAGRNTLYFVDAQYGAYRLNTQTLSVSAFKARIYEKSNVKFWNYSDMEYINDSLSVLGAVPGLFSMTRNDVFSRINVFSGANYNFDKIILNCTFKDKDGNLWIGSMEQGVYVVSLKKEVFTHYVNNELHNTLNYSASNILVNKTNRFLWGNTNGLFFSNSKTDLLQGRCKQLLDIPINNIVSYVSNQSLVFTAKMVYLFDFDSQKIREFYPIPTMQCGVYDSRGILWYGTWGWGLFGYNPRTHQTYKIDIDTLDRSRNVFFTLIEDANDGSLWVGTYGTGLVHIENPTSSKPKLSIYMHQKSTNSISLNEILSLHDDGRGVLWIGTCGGGLNRFDKKTKHFDLFSTKNGLKNNVIESINSDDDGNIWFVSSVLSKYDIKTNTISHFEASDGVSGLYYTFATYKGKNGQLYFSDEKGIISFNPRLIPAKAKPSQPVLTGVKLFGQTVNPKQIIDGIEAFPEAINEAQSISLPYFLNALTIEFASLRVLENKNISYSYMLEGVDKDWIPASANERIASYVGLQAGSYLFKVRSSNDANVWSDCKQLQITITPPFWKTVWFRILMTLCLCLLFSVLLSERIKKIRQKNVLLEKLVKNRTLELEQKTQSLIEQSKVLDQQTKTLLRHNTELSEKQVVIEMKNAQLEEALGSKDKLIGIIAHDFKNSLSAINGLSLLLRNKLTGFSIEKIQTYADAIYNASESLKVQMISVLDWAQSQVQDLVYNPVEINIETIIDDAILLVKESSTQKQINIITQLDYSTNALIDPRMISTVMRNLLINAIKFTPRNGTITVVLQEYDTGLEVNVIDSGIGMSNEVIDKLFWKSSTQSSEGTEHEKGVGLGLYICKLFIEQNKGTIRVSSAVGKGSVFSITMPKGSQAALRKREIILEDAVADEDTDFKIAVNKNVIVLLVDDNAQIITLLKAIFDPYYTVVSANDGNAGLQLARNLIPQIIISDVSMPLMSGPALCKQLKADEMTNHIPILLLSGQKEASVWRESYQSGADELIPKPINKDLLLYKVKSLLESKQNIIQQMSSKTDLKNIILPDDCEDVIIKRVFAYLNDNFSNPAIDVHLVAEAVGLSRTQLWRKFKSTTGYNMSDYVQDLRLLKAKEMFLTGKYKVAEVAYEVGYSNPQYFTKCFTQKFGESPREFLDRYKKPN